MRVEQRDFKKYPLSSEEIKRMAHEHQRAGEKQLTELVKTIAASKKHTSNLRIG